jgi:hypothetical protein
LRESYIAVRDITPPWDVVQFNDKDQTNVEIVVSVLREYANES